MAVVIASASKVASANNLNVMATRGDRLMQARPPRCMWIRAGFDQVKGSVLLTEALLNTGSPHLSTGTVFRDVAAVWCTQMVMIPAGTFQMDRRRRKRAGVTTRALSMRW